MVSSQVLTEALGVVVHERMYTVLPALVLSAFWFVWRLWRFTIQPMLNPEAPKELPYTIPFLGHAWAFCQNFNGTIDDGRKYFGNSDMPFTVNVAGKVMHICTAQQDVASLYRNTTGITNLTIVEDMFRCIGLSKEGLVIMFALDKTTKYNADMATPQTPNGMVVEYHRRQNLPGGPHLDEFLHKSFLPVVDDALRDVAQGTSPAVLAAPAISDKKSTHSVSLFDMSSEVYLRCFATAVFGKKIWDVCPAYMEHFEVWERTNWKFLFHLPDFMARDMAHSRDIMVNAFEKYLAIPAEERDDACYFIKSCEAMLSEAGISRRDTARILMLHSWAIFGNLQKVFFWSAAHLAFDAPTLAGIREEVLPAVKDNALDEEYLTADNCPLLDSFICEILRLSVQTALARRVIAPVHLRGKTIQPGGEILVPYRALHQNQTVWGSEPEAVTAARFKEAPKLRSSPAYRPFGGGATLCPGRLFAKTSLAYIIAATVTRFDMTLDKARMASAMNCDESSVEIPQMDITKPMPGACLPEKGKDVYVVLKAR